jgi:vacuolar protein sorting-associated protein 13A/C
MAIRLSAPIQVENLLPYDFTFRIVDKTTNQNWPDNYLRKGAVTSLHLIELNHLLLLNIDVQDSGIMNVLDIGKNQLNLFR